MTSAVALGFLLTAMLFIFEYTKHSPAQVWKSSMHRHEEVVCTGMTEEVVCMKK